MHFLESFTLKLNVNYFENYPAILAEIKQCPYVGRSGSFKQLLLFFEIYRESTLYCFKQVQRQIALNRQNNKTQTRVISLLQGNSSLLKQIPSTSSSGSSGSTQVRLPNTVLVKLASGSGQGSGSAAQTNKKVCKLCRLYF